MAVIGCLGDIVFQVSDKQVKTLREMKWSGSARYPAHNRHLWDAATEFTGRDPDKITFKMQLYAELGVEPQGEIGKLWNYERNGIAVPLTIGTKGYGKYRWNVVSHEVTAEYTDPRGNLLGATVSVELQEYVWW